VVFGHVLPALLLVQLALLLVQFPLRTFPSVVGSSIFVPGYPDFTGLGGRAASVLLSGRKVVQWYTKVCGLFDLATTTQHLYEKIK
jgi:hypothetical protein